jgi:SulP family sulfate permease
MIATPGTENYAELAIALSLMVGIIQSLLGALRFGFIANFLSQPVVVGYTSAAALVIIISQMSQLAGLANPGSYALKQLYYFLTHYSAWHMPTLLLSSLSLSFLVLCKKFTPKLPGALLLLVGSMLAAGLMHFSSYGIALIDNIPQGIPWPQMARLDINTIGLLWPTAVTVAFMSYVGSMSICKAEESPRDRDSVQPNREFIAFGVANMVGSMFRAFPASASFSRSAAFRHAGAKTQFSAVVSSSLLLLIIFLLTPLFSLYPLPKAVLAAIIIHSVAGLFKYGQMQALLKQSRIEFIILMITLAATLGLGVQQGLLTGVALSIVLLIYNSAKPHCAELGKLPNYNLYRNVERFSEAEIISDKLIFRFDAALFFANKDYFKQQLLQRIKLRPANSLRAVIIDAGAINNIDSTALMMLQQVMLQLQESNIQLVFSDVIGPVRDAMIKTHLDEIVSNHCLFSHIDEAIAYLDGKATPDERIAKQSKITQEQ